MNQKLVVITGAGRGIGKGIAETLAKSGYTCALIARNLKEIKNLEKKIQKNNGSAFCQLFPYSPPSTMLSHCFAAIKPEDSFAQTKEQTTKAKNNTKFFIKFLFTL